MSDQQGPDELSKAEIGKDAIQSAAEAAATTVGEVTTIITGAVKDVATAIGGFATEVFEIRESARKAQAEHDPDA
jgi:phage-related protein